MRDIRRISREALSVSLFVACAIAGIVHDVAKVQAAGLMGHLPRSKGDWIASDLNYPTEPREVLSRFKDDVIVLGPVPQVTDVAAGLNIDYDKPSDAFPGQRPALAERHTDVGRTFWFLLGSIVCFLIGYACLKRR